MKYVISMWLLVFSTVALCSQFEYSGQLYHEASKTLSEIKINFVRAAPGRDNWKDFIPLMERIVISQEMASNTVDMLNVESLVLEKFSLYAFACEYDFDEIKANFDSRIACLDLACKFECLMSDMNAVMMMADWLGGAQPIVVDEETEVRRQNEMSRIDELMVFGERRGRRKAGTYVYDNKLIEARMKGPYLSRCREAMRFRDIFNKNLPDFRAKAEARMRKFVFEEFKAKDEQERKALWVEFCRRAKFAKP